MPVVIDVRAADDQRDLVHRAVQALAEGKLVAFPTDTSYCVAASSVHEGAVARLAAWNGPELATRPTLAVKSADEAWDYAPRMGPLGQRLARRCWPGPLTLCVADPDGESLCQRLPAAVRQLVAPDEAPFLRVPAHPLIQSVLRLAPAPLVLGRGWRDPLGEASSASDVAKVLGDDVQLVLDDGPSRFGQATTVVRIGPRGYEIVRPGVLSEESLRRFASFILVFVCTGNTCRSPMAEVLMQRRLADKLGCAPESLEERGIWVLSAGVAAATGSRASPEANTAVNKWGMRLSEHESQPLSDRIVRFADLLLTMTRSHREAVIAQWPEASSRVRLLTRGSGDVADPIGGPLDEYRRCAEQIDAQLAAWVNDLDLGEFPFWDSANSPGSRR